MLPNVPTTVASNCASLSPAQASNRRWFAQALCLNSSTRLSDIAVASSTCVAYVCVIVANAAVPARTRQDAAV